MIVLYLSTRNSPMGVKNMVSYQREENGEILKALKCCLSTNHMLSAMVIFALNALSYTSP